MKKILFILLFCLFSLQVNAFDFNTLSHQEFDENAWVQSLSPITIDTKWMEVDTINLVIGDNDYFIFDRDLTFVSSIFSYKELQNWNKKLSLTFNNTFSWKLEISWIKIRLYDQEINGAKIGLDYDNNGTVDLYTSNYIDLEENDRYSDTMRTLPITNLVGTVNSDNSISFVWSGSVDLDNIWTLVKVYKNNDYGPFLEKFAWKTEKQEIVLDNLDLTNNYKIEFYSKDNYFLTDQSVVLKINDIFNENKDTWFEDTSTWVTVSTWVVDTTDDTDTMTWVINPPVIIEEPEVIMIDKYLPTFTRESFNTFMIKFDKIVDKKAYKDEVRIARNDIIKLLKDYEDKKVTKFMFKKKLKTLVIEFVRVYK